MRLLVLFFLVTPLLAISQGNTARQLMDRNLKKYADSSGEIIYTLSGDGEGQEVLAFTDFGWKSLRKQTMIFELYGIKTVQTLHEIIDGDYVYRLNEGDSTYTSRTDFKWSQQASYKDPQGTSEAILFALGGTHQADSVLLNKTCQVWTFENKALQELWVWNGLVLKRKTKLGNQVILSTATQITMDTTPDPALFQIPNYMKEKE